MNDTRIPPFRKLRILSIFAFVCLCLPFNPHFLISRVPDYLIPHPPQVNT